MNLITDRHTTQKFLQTKIHIQTKMNAYKDFYVFACMSVMKTCITGLVLKDKNAQHWKSFSYSSQVV